MEVVARDTDQNIGTGGVDGDIGRNDLGERPGSFGVDENRGEAVPRSHGPLDDDVSFGDEHAGHVAIRQLTFLPQDVVAEALEDLDARVIGVVDGDPAVDHRVWCGIAQVP